MPTIISVFIFLRPFISDLAFKKLDFFFTLLFFGTLFISFLIYKKFKKSPHDKIFFFFITALVISTAFSQDYLQSLRAVYKYVFLVLLFYFFSLEDRRDNYIFLLIASGLFISLYSLRSFFIVSKYLLNYLRHTQGLGTFEEEFILRKRIFMPFITPNLLGGYLVMIIPLCAGVILKKIRENRWDIKLVTASICICVSSVVLFLTKSLGAWMALLGSVCLYYFIFARKRRVVLLLILIISLIVGCIVFIRSYGNKEFTTPFFSFQKRVSYWSETISVISRYPLTGVGIGNFSLQDTVFAHNSFLQIWAEAGILGFISLLTIIFLFFKEGIRKIKKRKDEAYLGMFIAGTTFVLHNFIDFSFFITQVSFLWWILLGFILGRNGENN